MTVERCASAVEVLRADLAANLATLREQEVLVRSGEASAVHKMEFAAKPMLGCVGVAPAGDFAPTSSPSGNYGGNLDYNEIGEGTTVILPVFHPGALLFIASKALKYWAIRSLGARWSFRVLVLPGRPLVASGPYRYVRHPIYTGLSAMLTVIVMFVFPLWAIAVLTIDFLVLFGLLTQSDEFLA